MSTDDRNMWACELNNLSPTDCDVLWVYSNHGYICSTACVKERNLVSLAFQVDDTFVFWSMQEIPKIKKFKLTGDAERELASVAVALQLLSQKFSNSSVLLIINNWEVVRILNDEIITYDGTMKRTCVNFIKRYAMRKGMQVRYKFARSSNDILNCLKDCDVGKFKEMTSHLNATKIMPRDDCFTFL